MRSRSTFAHALHVLTATTILAAAPSVSSGSSPSPLSAQTARALERARGGAASKLQQPECQKVLTDFGDEQGHRLQETLHAGGLSATDYLRTITFMDGSSTRSCRRGGWVLLVAAPDVGSVGVCPMDGRPFTSRLAQVQLRNPSLAEAIVIHEMLHTLGLGEDPPSSEEITRQVQLRCGS